MAWSGRPIRPSSMTRLISPHCVERRNSCPIGQLPAAAARRRDERVAVGDAVRHRLLEQHMLACLQRRDADLAVQVIRNDNIDGVDGGVGEHALPVAMNRDVRDRLPAPPPRRRRSGRRSPRASRRGAFAIEAAWKRPHAPKPDQSKAQIRQSAALHAGTARVHVSVFATMLELGRATQGSFRSAPRLKDRTDACGKPPDAAARGRLVGVRRPAARGRPSRGRRR